MTLAEERAAYEAAVRALSDQAAALLQAGRSEADVAAIVITSRNALKARFRRDLSDEMLAAIEARNVAKYGNPIGPDAAALLARYGTWAQVIDAACRTADLSAMAAWRKTPR